MKRGRVRILPRWEVPWLKCPLTSCWPGRQWTLDPQSVGKVSPCSAKLGTGPCRDLTVWKASKGARGFHLLGNTAQGVVGLQSPLGSIPQATSSHEGEVHPEPEGLESDLLTHRGTSSLLLEWLFPSFYHPQQNKEKAPFFPSQH